MYEPIDRHGSSTYYTYDPHALLEQYKKENKELKERIKKLQKEKDFLLQGIVRQSTQGDAEKTK